MAKRYEKKSDKPPVPPFGPLVIELGHGTPFGIHFWMYWLGCAWRARLNTEHRKELMQLPMRYDPTDWRPVGTVVHGLLGQHYRGGLFNVDNIVYSEQVDDRIRRKAEEVYRAYRLRFPPDELGEVRAVEATYGLAPAQRKPVGLAVGAYPLPFTFGPDVEVFISKGKAKDLKKTRNIDVVPGLWLVDHKIIGWVKSEERYVQGLQTTSYCMGHYGLYGRKPNGMLTNLIPRDDKDYRTLVTPFPNAVKIQRLHAFFDLIKEKKEKLGDKWKNPAECVDGRDPCIWWDRGVCYGV